MENNEQKEVTVAIYKGKKYKLLWQGDTKYGNRAHLEWFNGENEFWVDSDKIEVVADGGTKEATEGPEELEF